jgi:hypothetical protein
VVKCAVGVVLAALATFIGMAAYHGTVWLDGAVSGWISGVGSLASALAALGIALYTYFKDRRDRREEFNESRQRALRRAKRVGMRPAIGGRLDLGVAYANFSIDNNSGSPLYEVQWYPPVIVCPTQFGRPRKVFRARGRGGTTSGVVWPSPPQVVENGRESQHPIRIELPPRFYAHPVAAFEDDDGNRFGWTLHGTVGRDDQLSGRWDFVDDEWPETCSGPLRELFDEAKAWEADAEEEEAAEEGQS